MKFTTKLLIVPLVLMLGACSFETVPPTAKGKILTTAGYSPDVLVPGKYTLWGRDQLVLLETNTDTYKETVTVVLQDKLTLTVDVRFRGRIAGQDKVINTMFSDITPKYDQDNGARTIKFLDVYGVYGKMIIRNKAREVISKYTVEDVNKNYGRISKEISKVVREALKNTPLELSEIALGDIKYPDVVIKAIDAAKKRELEIKQEEATAAIEMVKKKNERALAEADYQIKITQAKAVRDANKIIGQGITPQLIELKRLEVLKEMSNNKSAVFMPVEGMASTGASVRMFSGK